jgi:diaminopimelate epimerase
MSSPGVVIPFVKATACGNDFLIINGVEMPADIAGFTRRICNRHEGVGADGVEWLFAAADADVEARLFNADGSKAEISGNGTRCVAAYLCSEQPREKVSVRTGAGVKTCLLTAHSENQYEFEVAMGAPQVGEEIPIKLSTGQVRGMKVCMGNPHYVMFVGDFAHGWQAMAAEIGGRPEFRHGINVELVILKDQNNIDARFFERGAGETQSSGTGSCAAAVAAISAKRAKSPIRVHAPGGIQTVRWEDQVYLRGPAQLICRGEFFS